MHPFPHRIFEAAGQNVCQIQVGATTIANPDVELARMMEWAARAFNYGFTTTVWVDAEGPSLPGYVEGAVERMAGFGIGLVITCGKACSHPPGMRLPSPLLEALQRASRAGEIWHPLQKSLSDSAPF